MSRWREEPLLAVLPSRGPALQPPGAGWAPPLVPLPPRGLGWAQVWVRQQRVGCSWLRGLGSERRQWVGRGQVGE